MSESQGSSASLLQLQALDQQLAQLGRRHYALLQSRERTTNMRTLAQQQGREQLRLLRRSQEQLSDLSWELEDIEVRLRDLQAQQPGSGDHLLDREVMSLGRRRAQLEQQVLELMLHTDELQRQLPASRAELERRVSRHTQHELRLNQLIARIEGLIAERDQQRRQLAASLPRELLARYEALRAANSH